jgi:hypothetical protein
MCHLVQANDGRTLAVCQGGLCSLRSLIFTSCGVQNEGNGADTASKLPPSSTPAGPELASISEANPVAEAAASSIARPSFDSGTDEALRSVRCRRQLRLSTMTLFSAILSLRLLTLLSMKMSWSLFLTPVSQPIEGQGVSVGC